MTTPPDWVTAVPSSATIHTEPPRNYQWEAMTQDQRRAMRQQLIDSILQVIVSAVTGLLTPGNLFQQLQDWAEDHPNLFTDNRWIDLLGILGNPLGLGTGTPILSAIEDIPLLGNLINLTDGDTIDSLFDSDSVIGKLWDVFQALIMGGGGFGYTFPFNFGDPDNPNSVTWFFQNIREFLADFDFTDPDFNFLDAITAFINDRINLAEILAPINTLLEALLPDAIEGGIEDLLENFQTWVDNIRIGADGSDVTGGSIVDNLIALTGLRRAVVASAAELNELRLLVAGGAYASDDFTRTAADLGSDWSQTDGGGNGSWATDGADAYWVDEYPNGSNFVRERWIGATMTTSTTDYQEIKGVLSSAANYSVLFSGQNDLLGRMSSDSLNFIRFRCGGTGSWSVSRFVANIETVMASGTTTPPGAGATMTLLCGNKVTTTPRHFKAMIGTVVIADFDESGTASLLGASYRGWGHGARAESQLLDLFPRKPGKLNYWTARDQI